MQPGSSRAVRIGNGVCKGSGFGGRLTGQNQLGELRMPQNLLYYGDNLDVLPGLGDESGEREMPKSTRNTGKPWTSSDVAKVRELARQNTPTRVIGLKTGRTADAIYKKASEKGIPLKPTNQSPYNRRKP